MVRMLQFRYYADNNKNNYPLDWNWTQYCSSNTFKKYSEEKNIHSADSRDPAEICQYRLCHGDIQCNGLLPAAYLRAVCHR